MNKQFIVSKPADFTVSIGCGVSVSNNQLFLRDFTAAAVNVQCQAFLPRSTLNNQGSRLDSIVVNYRIQFGSITNFSATLTKEIYKYGEVKNKNAKNVSLNNPSPSFALLQSDGYNNITLNIKNPVFDNNDKDSNSVFTFTVSMNAAVDLISNLRLTQILISSITFNYTMNISNPMSAVIDENIINVNRESPVSDDRQSADGSLANPFKTITAALTSPIASQLLNNYSNVIVQVGPGVYNENISIPKNIFIRGTTKNKTTLNGSISFTQLISDDSNNCGILFCNIICDTIFPIDFYTNRASFSKIYFVDCLFTLKDNILFSQMTCRGQSPHNVIKCISCEFNNFSFYLTGAKLELYNPTFNGTCGIITADTNITSNYFLLKDGSGRCNINISHSSNNEFFTLGEIINFNGGSLSTLSVSGAGAMANLVSSTFAADQPQVTNRGIITNGNCYRQVNTSEFFRDECWVTTSSKKFR
jgi:hypothetical protein